MFETSFIFIMFKFQKNTLFDRRAQRGYRNAKLNKHLVISPLLASQDYLLKGQLFICHIYLRDLPYRLLLVQPQFFPY